MPYGRDREQALVGACSKPCGIPAAARVATGSLLFSSTCTCTNGYVRGR